jgi:hypothetical protein
MQVNEESGLINYIKKLPYRRSSSPFDPPELASICREYNEALQEIHCKITPQLIYVHADLIQLASDIKNNPARAQTLLKQLYENNNREKFLEFIDAPLMDTHHHSALAHAVLGNQAKMVSFLLDLGASPHQTSLSPTNKVVPISQAAILFKCEFSIIYFLAAKGAAVTYNLNFLAEIITLTANFKDQEEIAIYAYLQQCCFIGYKIFTTITDDLAFSFQEHDKKINKEQRLLLSSREKLKRLFFDYEKEFCYSVEHKKPTRKTIENFKTALNEFNSKNRKSEVEKFCAWIQKNIQIYEKEKTNIRRQMFATSSKENSRRSKGSGILKTLTKPANNTWEIIPADDNKSASDTTTTTTSETDDYSSSESSSFEEADTRRQKLATLKHDSSRFHGLSIFHVPKLPEELPAKIELSITHDSSSENIFDIKTSSTFSGTGTGSEKTINSVSTSDSDYSAAELSESTLSAEERGTGYDPDDTPRTLAFPTPRIIAASPPKPLLTIPQKSTLKRRSLSFISSLIGTSPPEEAKKKKEAKETAVSIVFNMSRSKK